VLSRLRHTFPLFHFITDLIDRPVFALLLSSTGALRAAKSPAQKARSWKKA